MTDFYKVLNLLKELKIIFNYSDAPKDMYIEIDRFYFEFDENGNFLRCINDG